MTMEFKDRGFAMQTEEDLRERLRRWRPWYGWLSVIRFAFVLPLLIPLSVLAYIVVALGMVALGGTYEPVLTLRAPSVFFWFLVLLLVSVPLGVLLDRFKHAYFPRVTLCIGQQEVAYQRQQRMLGLLVGTIGGGLVLGIISNYLFMLLTAH